MYKLIILLFKDIIAVLNELNEIAIQLRCKVVGVSDSVQRQLDKYGFVPEDAAAHLERYNYIKKRIDSICSLLNNERRLFDELLLHEKGVSACNQTNIVLNNERRLFDELLLHEKGVSACNQTNIDQVNK